MQTFDITDDYFYADISMLPKSHSVSPFDGSLWYFPEHDQIPPYLEPGDLGYSSSDDYDWSDPEGEFTDDSESSSIPIHARYDTNSDIDESRFSDTPNASSLLEEWNYEFWPAQQNDPAVDTPTNTTQSAPEATLRSPTLQCMSMTMWLTTRLLVMSSCIAPIDFRLVNIATVPPCMPWSRSIQHRHYENNLMSYYQTNCAHRLGAMLACVYNVWLKGWTTCMP